MMIAQTIFEQRDQHSDSQDYSDVSDIDYEQKLPFCDSNSDMSQTDIETLESK